jgi:hypothetical protein
MYVCELGPPMTNFSFELDHFAFASAFGSVMYDQIEEMNGGRGRECRHVECVNQAYMCREIHIQDLHRGKGGL